MGTNLNFTNFGNIPPAEDCSNGWLPGSIQRQSSIYSLTFDEFQNTVGGVGKDFGSMNMDELLKSIWSAEENQTMAFTSGGQLSGLGGCGNGGYLQRQGSLTLPRTLSQMKVDDVWRDISKEYNSLGKDGTDIGGLNMPRRQQTLGEMTLEEFLVKAGVVREDTQLSGKTINGSLFGDLTPMDDNNSLEISFQQTGRSTGLMNNRIQESSNHISIQPLNLPLNVNGIRSNQQQLPEQQAQTQQQLFHKQPPLPYASQMPLPSSAPIGSPVIRSGFLGISDQTMNGGMVHNGALQGGGMGLVGLGAGVITVATGSPANQMSSDGIVKSNEDTPSVSPTPYVFNGGIRGRRCGGVVEKVVERRQRRMIKNRESAARSRARKQAYTMELEAEVAKLKEENEEVEKKLAEIMEMQKNQEIEMMNMEREGKRQCLRRTQTGIW